MGTDSHGLEPAIYSPRDKSLFYVERVKGIDSSEAWEGYEIGKNTAELLASGEFLLYFVSRGCRMA
jgi:hypothetical protein